MTRNSNQTTRHSLLGERGRLGTRLWFICCCTQLHVVIVFTMWLISLFISELWRYYNIWYEWAWIVYITHNWSVGITIYRKVPSKRPWALTAQAPQKLGVGPYTENLLERLNHLLASTHPPPSCLQVEARNRRRALHCSGDIQHAWPLCSRHTEGYTDNRACFCWDLQSLLVFSETWGYKYRVSTDRLFFFELK